MVAAVSSIPQKAAQYGKIAEEAGRGRVRRAEHGQHGAHISTEYASLELAKFCQDLTIPIIVGNAVGYDVTLELMAAASRVCSSASVQGRLHLARGARPRGCRRSRRRWIAPPRATIPQANRPLRTHHHRRGMRTGGDVCKALACGSDAVMIGSPFAKAQEAPGQGHHWGMATPHANLPRGTRIKMGTTARSNRSSSVRPAWTTAAKTSSARSRPAWATSARRASAISRKRRSSSPRASRPKASFSRPSKASGWERAKKLWVVSYGL